MTDREVARLLWRWALWCDAQMNDAFCATSMAELEKLQMDPETRIEYERWRRVRESVSAGYPWLKERE